MNSLSLGGDEPHRTWLYPGEADEPGPTWLLQQKLPAGAGTSAGRSCPRFVPRLRKPREPAAPGSQGCFKELTGIRSSQDVQGKPLSSGLTARGEPPPIPKVRNGGPTGGIDQINTLVPVHFQVLSRHPACSLLPPLPSGVITGLKGQMLRCP